MSRRPVGPQGALPKDLARAVGKSIRAYEVRERVRYGAGFSTDVLNDVLEGTPGPIARLGRLADSLNKAARWLDLQQRAPSCARTLDDQAEQIRELLPQEAA